VFTYLTVNPRKEGLYVGTRQRGKELREPVTADPRVFWLRPDVGVMWTPAGGTRPTTWAWCPRYACDTGCYTQGERFDLGRYLAWLGGLNGSRDRCLFATAPDVVGDWRATWARSRDVLPRIRELGIPAAVVAQDGMVELPPPDEWDVLFVGGTTDWKLSERAYRLVRQAKGLGKRAHMGRCNSWRRLNAAYQAGYDTADGTCLAFNPPQYIPEISGWLDRLHRQPALTLWD
jgi:hypothetical protein